MTQPTFTGANAEANNNGGDQEGTQHERYDDGHAYVQAVKGEYRYVVFGDQAVPGIAGAKVTARGDDLQQVIEDYFQMRTVVAAMQNLQPLLSQTPGQPLAAAPQQMPAQQPQMPTAGAWGNPQTFQQVAGGMAPQQAQEPFQPTPQNVPQPGFQQPMQQGYGQPQQQGWSGGGGGGRGRGGGGGMRGNTLPLQAELSGAIPLCNHQLPRIRFVSKNGNVGFGCGGQATGVPREQQCDALWSEQNQR